METTNGPETPGTTIGGEMQRFLDQRAARSPHTARTYHTGLAHFTSYLAERGIDLSDSPAHLTRAVALDFVPWLARLRFRRGSDGPEPVSYTHLTLPTILLV